MPRLVIIWKTTPKYKVAYGVNRAGVGLCKNTL